MILQIENMKQLKIIISGGGSGGHIFPAIAIAKSMKEQKDNIDFLFVGASDKMEMDKVPNEGFKIIGLWISGFHRGKILRNLLFPIKLIFSLVKSFFIIKKFKLIPRFENIVIKSKLLKLFNINLDIFIRTLVLTFSFLWVTYLGSKLGEDYLAVNTILMQFIILAAFFLDAYAFSTEGVVGFTIGRKVKNSFLIVTGANMAGKSTFLRTISLSIVMANIGLPVCANSFKYKPVKLITSMRTADSLAENESYFYSELKRLKLIVDTVKTDDYFIVLDEILKGTNSKDKASGAKKFVEKLVTLNTTGIIATHDVSLCELENDFMEIKNFFFDAKISNNELSFDYLFKKGVCENRNASFLLKKMKII